MPGQQAAGTAHLLKRNSDAGSSLRCGKGFFSRSQLPLQTLLRCPYSPCVQSHASTSVRTLKIPNTGNHTLFGLTNILHALIGGSSALAAFV